MGVSHHILFKPLGLCGDGDLSPALPSDDRDSPPVWLHVASVQSGWWLPVRVLRHPVPSFNGKLMRFAPSLFSGLGVEPEGEF